MCLDILLGRTVGSLRLIVNQKVVGSSPTRAAKGNIPAPVVAPKKLALSFSSFYDREKESYFSDGKWDVIMSNEKAIQVFTLPPAKETSFGNY